jgi:hypothetical protein
MTTPVRLRLSRAKGFDLQAASRALNGLDAVNCARPGRWGNPVVALRCWYHGPIPALGLPEFDAVTAADADREGRLIAVELYRREVAPNLDVTPLRGRNLACWCKEPPCHVDVLLGLANRPVCEEVRR